MKNKVISIIVLLAFVMMGGSGCSLFGHKKKDHNDTLSYSLPNVETDQKFPNYDAPKKMFLMKTGQQQLCCLHCIRTCGRCD